MHVAHSLLRLDPSFILSPNLSPSPRAPLSRDDDAHCAPLPPSLDASRSSTPHTHAHNPTTTLTRNVVASVISLSAPLRQSNHFMSLCDQLDEYIHREKHFCDLRDTTSTPVPVTSPTALDDTQRASIHILHRVNLCLETVFPSFFPHLLLCSSPPLSFPLYADAYRGLPVASWRMAWSW